MYCFFSNSKRLFLRGVYRQSYVIYNITVSRITHITPVALMKALLKRVTPSKY